MKKVLSVLIGGLLLFSFIAPAQDIKPQGFLNDYAGVFNSAQKQNIENILSRIEKKTGVEFAVVIVNSTAPSSIDRYANDLFNKWKIGKKGKDNGLLLLIALKDRKLRIETGYGLEGILPDAICKLIIIRRITPFFKEGRFYEGVLSGVASVAEVFEKEYHTEILKGTDIKTESLPKSRRRGSVFGFLISIIFFIIIFSNFGIFGLFFLPFGSGGSWSDSGGGFSGGFGGFGGGFSGGGGAGGGW